MITKLNNEHKNQFEDFIEIQIEAYDLSKNHLWQNIEFTNDNRQVYGVFKDDKLVQTIASNLLPNMPWSMLDTQITKKGLTHFQTIKDTTKLFHTMFDHREDQGIWGHWYARDARLDKASKANPTTVIDGVPMTRYAAGILRMIGKKYQYTEAAHVKAGHLTNNKLYDYCIGNKPLPYDVAIRFLFLRTPEMFRIADKVTYGI